MKHVKLTGKGRLIATGLTGVGILLAMAGMAYALWIVQTHITDMFISTGDLSLILQDGRWTQVTPGLPESSRSAGHLTSTLNSIDQCWETWVGGSGSVELFCFQAMPGDVIVIEQELTVYLRGDNLMATLDVDFSANQSASIEATMQLMSLTGAPLSDRVAVGQPIASSQLQGSSTGHEVEMVLNIEITILGEEHVWRQDIMDLSPHDQWNIGALYINLRQVRGQANLPGVFSEGSIHGLVSHTDDSLLHELAGVKL